ncbi:type I-U CRISPR-associated RAMP protein Csb1/Cas7u [Stomatohabitans albus]|uniref:type I-G CRISPR-associated RAMP protein Csb1/Cas7g n=1 Tax=Stomatohabitans albus TaxID=3110766 RepID=UPI00300D5D2C
MDIKELTEAVAGAGTAFRVSAVMQPVGGAGTPVYPATYAVPDNARTRYAVEGPILDEGETERTANHWETALLMSVAQGARGLQYAVQDKIDAGEVSIPLMEIDFTSVEDGEGKADLADLGALSTLGLPHRVYDAAIRDSLLDGTLFRLSDIGRAITEARPGDATALYQYAPTVLLFGGWDSTGPKGGLGSKFERAIYSEIVAHDIRLGVKVGSRIDPLEIEKVENVVYKLDKGDEEWVLKADAGGAKGKAVRPSEINHGNVTPSIDKQAGGIVMDHATHTCVLSLGTLRKLRFATYPDGTAVPREKRKAVNDAVRTVIAALGLVAITSRMEGDFALRSRCDLINEGAWTLELIGKHAQDISVVSLTANDAITLLNQAVAQAASLGMTWESDPIVLYPADKLVGLIRASREKLMAENPTDGGEG